MRLITTDGDVVCDRVHPARLRRLPDWLTSPVRFEWPDSEMLWTAVVDGPDLDDELRAKQQRRHEPAPAFAALDLMTGRQVTHFYGDGCIPAHAELHEVRASEKR